MEGINFLDLLIVGLPEKIMSFAFALIYCHDLQVFRNKGKLVVKVTAASAVILLLNYFGRSYIESRVITTLLPALAYMFCLKYIFKRNYMQSAISGALVVLVVILSEILIMEMLFNTLYEFCIKHGYNIKFIFSIPVRGLHLVVIVLIYKINVVTLKNRIILTNWNDLTQSRKITIIILIIFLFTAITFNANYGDTLLKIRAHQAQVNEIIMELDNIEKIDIVAPLKMNTRLFYIGQIIFIICTMLLLNRTLMYENLKDMYALKKTDLVNALWQSCNTNEKEDLLDTILNVLDSSEVDILEKKFRNIKNIVKGG